MSEELKPCPFCGGKADVVCPHNSYYVKCRNCGCQQIGKYYRTEQAAIKVWNTRAENTCTNTLKHSGFDEFKCSSCGYGLYGYNPYFKFSDYKYCPQCGAEVVEE